MGGISSNPLCGGSNDHPCVFCLDDSLNHLKHVTINGYSFESPHSGWVGGTLFQTDFEDFFFFFFIF